MISGSNRPGDPLGGPRSASRGRIPAVGAAAKARTTPEVRESTPLRGDSVTISGDELHRTAQLRKTVDQLLVSGELDATRDGQVRPGRVEEARRNLEDGAYSRRDVLSGIVDRLIERWNI